jgi:hypothetical protein
MAKKRRWVLVLFGVAVLIVFLGIGVIVGITVWFQQNMQVQGSTDGDAQTEFEAIRKKFGGREPLLELRSGTPHYTAAATTAHASTGEHARLDTLHVLVWDPDDEELSRISLPFWLLRIKSDPIRLGSYASGLDDGGVELRPEDIEKYGPGVILDTALERGQRVLLWAQ